MSYSFQRVLPFLIGLFLLQAGPLDAQKDFKKDADRQFENGAFHSAIELYKKAYSATRQPSEKAEISYRIGESYRQTNDDEQAEVWYRKAIKAQYDDPKVILRLAQSLKRQGKYEEAISEFKNYKEKKPDDPLVEEGIGSSEKAKEWMDEPTRHEVEEQVLLNSKKRDFAPTFANRRKNQVIFTSARDEAVGEGTSEVYGESYEDLFSAELDREGKWSVPTGIGEAVNTEHHEGAGCVDSRFRTLYFTRSKFDDDNGLKTDIYKSEKKGRDWGKSEVVEGLRPEENDSALFGHPALGFRDEVMVFVSDLEGGQGGNDLWMVVKEGRGTQAKWGEPVNLGSEINTEDDEMYPFIRDDGTLFFASNGHPGMGGLDLFKAPMIGNEDEDEYEWGEVENLKYPLNSPKDDFGIIYESAEDEKGYFSSDREGGRGKDDIYSFRIPPLKFQLMVHTMDKETKEPLDSVLVELNSSDGNSYQSYTDKNGMVDFDQQGRNRVISEGNTYKIEASKEKYLNATGQISTVGYEESRVFNHEMELQPTEVEGEKVAIELPEVRYPLDEATLLVNDEINSKDSLDFLYDILQENPNIVIELQAHTDLRGSDEYNKELSQRRAETCVEYLKSKGIDSARMVPKGYGEDRPRITEEEIAQMQTEEEKEAAHQKNRRTEFIVLREDYVPDDQEEGDGEGEEGSDGESEGKDSEEEGEDEGTREQEGEGEEEQEE